MSEIVGHHYEEAQKITWEIWSDGKAYSDSSYTGPAYRWMDGAWRTQLASNGVVVPASEKLEEIFQCYLAKIVVGPRGPAEKDAVEPYKIELLCGGPQKNQFIFRYPPAMLVSWDGSKRTVTPVRRNIDGTWHFASYGYMNHQSKLKDGLSDEIEAAYEQLLVREIAVEP